MGRGRGGGSPRGKGRRRIERRAGRTGVEGGNVARVGEVRLGEYVGEFGRVGGEDVGCLLKKNFKGNNVREMCENDRVD